MDAEQPVYDAKTKFRTLVVTIVAAGLVFLDSSIAIVALVSGVWIRSKSSS
jgi:hypothetical protein